jgi:PAS domain S-box-containing protein
MDNMTGRVFFKDTQSVYISCNKNYAKDHQKTCEEMIGLTDFDLYPKKLAEKYRSDDQKVIHSKVPAVFEEVYHAGRKKMYISTTKVPILNSSGNVLGILGIFRDITKQKKQEQELKIYQDHLQEMVKQKEKECEQTWATFKILFEDSNDGKLIADPQTKKFYMANPAMCKMLGYTKKELLKLGVEDIHPKENLPEVEMLFKKQAQGIEKLGENVPMKRKDGSIFFVDLVASPVMVSGKLYLQGSFHDVTERKKAQEALEQIVRMKGEFVAMISHALKTPLSSLKESISLSLDLDGNLSEEQMKILTIAQNNVERLSRLINQVLTYQSLELGKIKYTKATCDINFIVKELAKSVKILMDKKKLKLIIELGKGIPSVFCDSDRIYEVIMNLFNNSYKATDKGYIKIKTQKVKEGVKVSVKDTGKGIPNDKLQKLFIAFEQIDKATGGTGLGLFIAKQIISAHHGTISVQSVLGKGSTFSFILPIKTKGKES